VPEVVGDAGILVEPNQPDGLRKAMENLISNPVLQATLSRRGYARLSQFSWDEAARKTMDLISGVVE
jgi:glycosyltransferase involved in cell wall biosynthesis